jgi:hypothetical protein
MRKALAAGVLISLAGFALVFWAAGRFLSLLPRLEASRWFHLATNAIVPFAAAASSAAICLRKRCRKTNAAHR